MSVICCNSCERYVDTDYDVEGEWDVPSIGFVCGICVERYLPDGCSEDDVRNVLAKAIKQDTQP